jgi:hypothetical protein
VFSHYYCIKLKATTNDYKGEWQQYFSQNEILKISNKADTGRSPAPAGESHAENLVYEV